MNKNLFFSKSCIKMLDKDFLKEYYRGIKTKEIPKMKKFITIIMAIMLCLISVFSVTACNDDDKTQKKLNALEQGLSEINQKLEEMKEDYEEQISEISPLGAESYKKLKYIDKNLSDRDCFNGENFKEVQNYIKSNLLSAGYAESDITMQEVPVTKYFKTAQLEQSLSLSAVKSYTTDGKTYVKNSWKDYTEDALGEYSKVTAITENIVVTKQGVSDKQIIVGMHYDGTGTGDNGSGVALGLTTAQHFKNVKTQFTIKFVFFTAEEYGCYGSSYYADNMTETEVNNTLYMINMDSLVCGDYCYLYGGVQDNTTQTVNKTEAYDNAMKLAESLGLSFKSNPWTWDNIAPENDDETYPDYASPSTGDWSDHVGFKDNGITYLYFEATNWEIPDYTGYGESVLAGMLMNTENDYLDYIETYYPGRPLAHLTKFATLLNALLLQKEWNY